MSFSRQKPLKSKNKKHTIVWNTKSDHPANRKLWAQIKSAKVVPTVTHIFSYFFLELLGRMTAITFSRQNDADSRARTTYYWYNLVALSSFSDLLEVFL